MRASKCAASHRDTAHSAASAGHGNAHLHASAPRPTPAPRTLADLIAADPRLGRFAEVLKAAGLQDKLADPARRLTVFAPTNTAFTTLLPERSRA